LELSIKTGANHYGSTLSCTDILAVLYSDVLKFKFNEPNSSGRDFFILSKGHAALALYSTLAEAGFFPRQDLLNFKSNGSQFSGMVSSKIPGVELSTGSLGQGLGYAVGIAFALKQLNRPNRVYCLIGDGENDEGAIFESLSIASESNLSNLTVIIDQNHQKAGSLLNKPLKLPEIYQSFDFEVINVDGHNHPQLLTAFNKKRSRPTCIIAKTIKGKGVKLLEQSDSNHNLTLTFSEFKTAWSENPGEPYDFLDAKADYAR
jgi:transketolase